MSPILENVLKAEDFNHLPEGHLISYRPLLYVDLLFWNYLLGKQYLLTAAPKVLAGIYISVTGLLSVSLLRRWNIPISVAIVTPIFYFSHPVLNEISLYNVEAPYNLSILLIVLGYLILKDALSYSRIVPAIFLLALGLSSYQIHSILLIILIAGEFAIKRLTNLPFTWYELLRKLAIMLIAVFLYWVYIKFSQTFLGIHSWGDRGFISFSSMQLADYISDKWHGITNMYANLFQAIISFYWGKNAAFQIWEQIPIGLSVITLLISLYNKRSVYDTVLFVSLPIFFPLLAAFVLLPLNVTPMGWRICGPIVYAFIISLVPILTMISGLKYQKTTEAWFNKKSRHGNILVFGIVICWIMIAFPVIAYDGKLRVLANETDTKILRSIDTYWKARGIQYSDYTITVCALNRIHPDNLGTKNIEHDIVIDFNKIGCDRYSNIWGELWPFYLKQHGYQSLQIEDHKDEIRYRIKALCENSEEDCNRWAIPIRVIHIEFEKISVICKYNSAI
jgi:hypothetical protein